MVRRLQHGNSEEAGGFDQLHSEDQRRDERDHCEGRYGRGSQQVLCEAGRH